LYIIYKAFNTFIKSDEIFQPSMEIMKKDFPV
jgi:hypothetical protein